MSGDRADGDFPVAETLAYMKTGESRHAAERELQLGRESLAPSEPGVRSERPAIDVERRRQEHGNPSVDARRHDVRDRKSGV